MVGALNHFQDRLNEKLARSAEREWRKESTDWAKEGNINKCNLFVQDMMVENEMNPTNNALRAGDWGDPNRSIPGYKIVSNPRRGDIAAFKYNYSHASGHMGILADSKFLIYAGPRFISKSYLYAKGFWDDKNWVFRRYIGK